MIDLVLQDIKYTEALKTKETAFCIRMFLTCNNEIALVSKKEIAFFFEMGSMHLM